MVRLVTRAFSQKEWSDIVAGFRDLTLMQTWEYAEAKTQGPWKVERAVFLDGDRVIGAVQAMIRPVPWLGGGLVWINRGPLWRTGGDGDVSMLVAMLGALERRWVDGRRMYLRIAPALWQGEADSALFVRNGYSFAKGADGWASARLDLSCSIETLRSRLRSNWRNQLRKAERLGLVVERGTDDDRAFSQLLADYEDLLRHRGFTTTVTPSFLSRLQALLPDDRKLLVLAARQGGQRVGSILVARHGETCEYLVGVINPIGRTVNAHQFLLWQAFCQMKALGYRWFDMGGMDSRRTPKSIFHFKSGAGGLPYRLSGELEACDGRWLGRLVRWRVRRARQEVGA